MFVDALDRLAGQDLAVIDDARLEADVTAIDRAIAGLTAQRLRRVAEVERRRGARAAEAWLQTDGRLSPRAAAQQRQTAQRLETLPQTAAALAAGDIDAERATILAAAATDARRDALVADEPALVEAATTLDASALRRHVDQWRHTTDTAASLEEADARHERRWLKIAATDDGMLSIRGELDLEQGAIVQTALNALRPDPANGSFAQRTADALTEVCRRVLALDADLPAVHGRRPHVSIVVTAETLADAPGAPAARMDWVGGVCSETARRYSCDAWLTRVIVAGEANRWTSAGPPAPPPSPNAPRWPSATAAASAASAAVNRRSCARPTTSAGGNSKAPPIWRILLWSAGAATARSTKAAGTSSDNPSTAGTSIHPTARCRYSQRNVPIRLPDWMRQRRSPSNCRRAGRGSRRVRDAP